MQEQDSLHQLVHSLTPSEKRYFRIYTKTQGGNKNYILVFDAMEKHVKYNRKDIVVALKGKKMNLSYEKKYLAKTILKSLRNFQNENNPANLLLELLLETKILIDKQLWHAAWDTVQEAHALAVTHSRTIAFPILPVIFHLECLILRLTNFKNMNEKQLKEWLMEYAKSMELANANSGYEILLSEIDWLHSFSSNKLTNGEKSRMDEIIEHPLMQKDINQLPTLLQLYYLEINLRNDAILWKDLSSNLTKQAEVLMADKNFKKFSPTLLIDTLHNGAQGYATMGRIDKMEELKQQLQKVTVNKEAEICSKARSLTQIQFKLMEIKGVPGEASQWLNENMPALEKLIAKLPPYDKSAHLSAIGLFYLCDNEPDKALDYFTQVTRMELSEKHFFYLACWIFLLPTHYDLKNFSVITHMVRSIERILKKLDRLGQLEKTIINNFSKLSGAKTKSQHAKKLKDFEAELTALPPANNEVNMVMYNTLKAWVGSKLNGQHMVVLMKTNQ